MTKYLLAAEADKIQDLLFRSAKLREVAGGSQLLTRFCREAPAQLGVPANDIVINDGGSFRILFDTQEEALAFGEYLAEVYRRATGGTLTVAEPVPVNGRFGQASEQAHQDLRRAKRRPKNTWQGQEHQPYIAFCASCGVGLAIAYQAYHLDGDKQYLCASCRNKGREGRSRIAPGQPVEDRMGEFLAEFYGIVAQERGIKIEDIHWPGETKNPITGKMDPLGDVAEYDPRRYVAYLVADGNNMGQVFGACETSEQMRQLSKGLTQAVGKALAGPTRLLMEKQEHPRRLLGAKDKRFAPVYPLILGGDDVFVLLPAPWALDFARRFAQAYEREMKALLAAIGLDVQTPTISVAVVICKNKHPYTLAHEAGERRLSEAKQMGKRLQLIEKPLASTITFEVVLGGRLVKPVEHREVRPTLRPYWAQDKNQNEDEDLELDWGLPIGTLLDQRSNLATSQIPRKRLAELRDLFDTENLPQSMRNDDIAPWQKQLDQLLNRIGRTKEHRVAVEKALQALGGSQRPYWREVSRQGEDVWYGQGFPDLLETWDFALKLDKSAQDYEEA